ncbi:unnamed protein product [Rotaria sordida]|uniref:NACHT domain-containing protein n=1 Tax=Rotaria sordida TaxID=392033 RepID=A0A818PPK3_9BILA|nr:unnamed protein product [Rotaria sordida]
MATTLTTYLCDAIDRKDPPRKISRLLKEGVDCNLSRFDPTKLKFVSPIQLAAEKSTCKYGTLHLLYRKRNSPTKTQLQKHLAFFCDHYQVSNEEENELFLEFTVCRLLHNRICQYPPKEMRIIIEGLLGHDKAKFRGEKLNIGSTNYIFLQVRIYALFQWLVDMKTNISIKSESETFNIIENELSHNLEAYYLLHDIQHIPVRMTESMDFQQLKEIESFEQLQKFYESIAENVINKIKQLQPQQEYFIPTGWRHHAVCVSFRRIDQTYISIRVDNPSGSNPSNMHEMDSDITNVPLIRPKVLGRLSLNKLDENKNYIKSLIDSVKRNLEARIAIPLIYDTNKTIKDLDRRHEEYVPNIVEQAADNCVVKCFEPGLRTRFGEQHKKLCEKLIFQHEINVVNKLIRQCEMEFKCFVEGSPDRFIRFAKFDEINKVKLTPNASLQEKIKMSYKKHCRLLSNVTNEECSRPLKDRFIHLLFKEENTIIELKNLFREPRVLIVGEVGSGKTTVCQYAAYSWACQELWESQFDWLFYIRMRNLNSKLYPLQSNNYSLVDIIVRECFRGCTLSHLEKSRLEYAISCSSNIVWILDGCDERTIPDHLIAIEQELLDKDYLLLTSRPYGTNKCHYDIKVHIQNFTEDNIEKYINKYFSICKHSAAKECWSFIRYSDPLKKAAHIPIYLELICILWDSGKVDFNDIMTTGELYEKIYEYLLRRYLLKFYGICASALAGHDIFQHSSIKEFTYLEYLAFLATKSHTFSISGHQISNVAGALFLPLLQIGLLEQRSRDHISVLVENGYYFIHRSFQEYLCARYIRRALTSLNTEKQTEVMDFITEEKYNRCMEDTFKYFFSLSRISSCTEKFWLAVDYEPRDLVGLRHFYRIMRWFPYASCRFDFDDKKRIDERVIDVIKEWMSNRKRRPHDCANAYLFECFENVINKQVWLEAWKNDLFEENPLNRLYFMSDLWSETNIIALRNIYDQIPKDLHAFHCLIHNGPTTRNLKSLKINTDLFIPPLFDKQSKIPEFLKEAQNKAKPHESIMTPGEFQKILQNYSSFANLNRQKTLSDQIVWPLIIAPSALINIDDETLELILKLSQQNVLFYRDFKLPIIPFLELYKNSIGSIEKTLCSLIVSIALSSTCIIMALPKQTTSILVYQNETYDDIKLSLNRRLALILEFDRIRQEYGYSTTLC